MKVTKRKAKEIGSNGLRAMFEALPYCGNHSVTGRDSCGNRTATFTDNANNVWEFSYDSSWDNVDLGTVNGIDVYNV